MVIGIVGSKGSGKDTLAQYIHKHCLSAKTFHYADRLKDICHFTFHDQGLTPVDFSHEILKERKISSIHIDNFLPNLAMHFPSDMHSAIIQNPRGLVARTPRQLLQFVGTEYIRRLNPDYWVNFLVNRIENECPNVASRVAVISDIRFLNEADGIRHLPDHRLIRVRRQPKKGSKDQHVSETELEKIQVDHSFEIAEGDWYRIDRIAQMMAFGLKTEPPSQVTFSRDEPVLPPT